MRSGVHPIPISTVCVRDDDRKTFEFLAMDDSIEIVAQVSAALAKGRSIRCATVADSEAQERERRFLVTKGYKEAAVEL